jgi:hypothetical protein
VVTTDGGKPVSRPSPPGPRHAEIAAAYPDVAEALAIIGQSDPPKWFELYKVMEIVEHAGALKSAMAAGGISANRKTLFTRTADHHKASGVDARHARSNNQPPNNPMGIEEAREMIGRLLGAWMDLLWEQRP